MPILLVVGTFLFVTAGRDTDYGAALRFQFDERQQLARLKTQALVGRVLSIAVAIAYAVVLATQLSGRGRSCSVSWLPPSWAGACFPANAATRGTRDIPPES